MPHLEEYMLPCLNKKLFGFDCPGCGMQRSLMLIFEGDFVGAFYMYPAIYLMIPLSLAIIISTFYKYKHASKIINSLAILTITTIITTYLIKIL